MRYIYALKNKKERNDTDLKEYKCNIKKALKGLDESNKNYVVVNKESFEFSSPNTILIKYLQNMGKQLAKLGLVKDGFARQNSKAYAFLTFDESKPENEQVLVELADCSTVDLDDEYRQDNIPEWVSFYKKVELMTTYISVEKVNEIFGIYFEPEQHENTVFLVEYNHYYKTREEYQEYRLSDKADTASGKGLIIEHLYSEGDYNKNIIDLIDIKGADRVSGPEEMNVLSKFNTGICKDGAFEQPDKTEISHTVADYTFTVHNVGQALATSLEEKNKEPFFYFDYGIAYGPNKFTLPDDAKLPISENATILVSHMHEDHWCGFRINPKALKCKWIIPQQPKQLSKAYKKMLASVRSSGGHIVCAANGLNIVKVKGIDNCMVVGNAASAIKPSRVPKNAHETGSALYIFGQNNHGDYKISVSGDQEYDYQDNNYINDINLLVACHHGGDYSWSKKATVPKPNAFENEIVYSYGEDNTYNHPTKIGDYKNQGWNSEHHTAKHCDYSIDLKLMNNSSLEGIIKVSNPMAKVFEV